ncbi:MULTISPECIES: GGDEF domain-containing protein [Deefgea]|uniref:diguanylate cyclase n=1 Tax=Deefgea chitinilytica TaxID=570276 RepID=A0ABS2CBX1_9NEIS|nr:MULTISPECIES: GGDEF domain-containing protein [Deefgea]MBM5571640.1 diguanylate cyclase [Deefgea chitinilytica]MBM9888875.1 diguanylate cyclase [Deefgea sp. CFH1-16]
MKISQFSDAAVTSTADIDALLHKARAQYRVNCLETRQLAQAAYTAAEQLNYLAGLAHAEFLIGKAQLILQTAETALPRLRAALKRVKPLALPQLEAEILISLATAQQMQGQFHAAFLLWLDALQSALCAQARECYVEAYLGLGDLHVQCAEPNKALHFLTLAVEWADLCADQDLRCKARLHLAAVLVTLEQYSLAERILMFAQTLLILPLRRDWQAEIYNYLGMIHAAQHDNELALTSFNQALKINAEAGFLWGQTLNLLGLGRLKVSLQDAQGAEADLQQALHYATQFNGLGLLQQIHHQLYQIYEARGDYVHAMMHHIGFHDHYMKLQQQLTASKLSAVDARRLSLIEMKLKLLASELEVTQLKQQRHQESGRMLALESAAYRDALTGVYNRRALEERLPILIQSAQQNQESLWAIMIDFDHFKRVNDHFSHHIGDVVLRNGCAALSKLTRERDMLARYGGEEFVLIVTQVDATMIGKIAERMRRVIEQLPWQEVHAGLEVTISLGGAPWLPGQTCEQLMSRADQALYAAKGAGRNCVRFMGIDDA